MAAAESTVWTWGRAKNYRLGRAFVGTDARVPEKVSGFEGVAVRQAACGGGHTAVVLEDNRLFVFGYSQYGQLGLGDRNDMCDATQVYLVAPDGVDYTTHPLNNQNNGSNKLVNDHHINNVQNMQPLHMRKPEKQPQHHSHHHHHHGNYRKKHHQKHNLAMHNVNATLPVAQVACGRYHTIARTGNGLVFTWGGGKNGRLGHGDEKIRAQPTWVEHLRDEMAVSVTAGYHNNLVLTEKGQVWSWGWGAHGQLGLGDIKDRDVPTIIEELSHERILALSCGDRHSFAVTDEGKVYGWGSNEFGQLGCGKKHDTVLRPSIIEGLAGLKVIYISSGDRHSAAITNTGAVYTWGCGSDGQCGHGMFHDVTRPKLVDKLVGKFVTDVKCGHNFTMVMTSDNEVFTWGNNTYGQLGNNGNGKCHTPVKVISQSAARISKVSCGHFHCIMWMELQTSGVDENAKRRRNVDNKNGQNENATLVCDVDDDVEDGGENAATRAHQRLKQQQSQVTNLAASGEHDDNGDAQQKRIEHLGEAHDRLARILTLYAVKRDECRREVERERMRAVWKKMQALQERINQLEIEKASLVHANEEATSLFELTASKNEHLRREAARLREVGDERERELERLRQQHDAAADKMDQLNDTISSLSAQVKIQEMKLKQSNDMELSLRQTITNLQKQKDVKMQGRSLLSLVAFHRDASAAVAVKHTDSEGNAPDHQLQSLLSSMVSIHITIFYLILPSRLSFPKVAIPLIDALQQVDITVRQLFRWISSSLSSSNSTSSGSVKHQRESLPSLDFTVASHIDTLFERVMASVSDLVNPSFPVTHAAPVDVQVGLLALSIEAIEAYTSSSTSLQPSPIEGNSDGDGDFMKQVLSLIELHSQRRRRKDERGDTSCQASSAAVRERQSGDAVAKDYKRLVEDRERKLDEAVVRCQAFEEALSAARQQIEELKEKMVRISGSENGNGNSISSGTSPKATSAQSPTTAAASTTHSEEISQTHQQERNISSSPKEASDTTSAVKNDSCDGQSVTQMNRAKANWDRLRGCYLRGAVSDLCSLGSSGSGISDEEQKLIERTHETTRNALYRARLAAANAHVVKLDPVSLKPITCGTTMSHRGILESISAARRAFQTIQRNQRHGGTETNTTKLDVTVGKRDDVNRLKTLVTNYL